MKVLISISSNENYIFGFSQVGTFHTVNSFNYTSFVKCVAKNKKNLSINEVSYNMYCQKNRRISFAMLQSCLNVLKQFII